MENIKKFLDYFVSYSESLGKAALCLTLVFFILFRFGAITDLILKGNITQANLGLITVTEQNKETLTKVARNNDSTNIIGPEDKVINSSLTKSLSLAQRQLVDIKPEMPSSASSWLFAGSYSSAKGKWHTRYLNFPDDIKPESLANNRYYARQPANLRDSFPVRFNGGWQKGNITGAIDQGEIVTVEKMQPVPGKEGSEIIWLKIKLTKN